MLKSYFLSRNYLKNRKKAFSKITSFDQGACGEESNNDSGGVGFSKCYCDVVSNSSQWKHDEGHLTNKDQLPVTKINFGGLGQHSEQPREAKFQLGPLYCVGADPGDIGGGGQPGLGGSPASCRDLWLRGYNHVSRPE